MKATEKTMEKIVALCKNRGFVYSGSEIYGGLSNTWIMALWALNLRIMSNGLGIKSLFRKAPGTSALMLQS